MTMTEILLAAKAEGLSYGQYVAQHRPHTSFGELEDAKALNKRRFNGESVAAGSRTCEYCGNSFISKSGKARFCSTACGQRARNARKYGHEKACAFCGKPFISNRSYKKCCSDECAREYRLEQQRTSARNRRVTKESRQCIICGESISGAPGGQRYCSEACRLESTRRRRKQRAEGK